MATKPYWIFFLKDPINGIISAHIHGHNARADYKSLPHYLGNTKIEVDIKDLKP